MIKRTAFAALFGVAVAAWGLGSDALAQFAPPPPPGPYFDGPRPPVRVRPRVGYYCATRYETCSLRRPQEVGTTCFCWSYYGRDRGRVID